MSRLFAILFALALFAANLQMVAAADQCSILTSEDVQTIAGVHVQNVPFMSKPGAGGKCANFAADNGRLYLGVSQLSSAADYAAEVAAVPQAVFSRAHQAHRCWRRGDPYERGTVLCVIWSPARASAKSSCFLSEGSQPTTCSSSLQRWR